MIRQFQAKAPNDRGAASALASLLSVRELEEQHAERALAEAVAARMRAETEALRLKAEAEAARAELAARRRDAPAMLRAADMLARRRFIERIEARVRAQVAAAAAFVREHVQPARRGEDAARAAHLRARTRRELVQRAIARREAARRRELERRAEAAVDDANGGARRRKDPRD